MKKIPLLFLLISFSINAQQISGTILYDADFLFSPIDTANVELQAAKEYVLMAMKRKQKALAGHRPMYRLDFNPKAAIYTAIPELSNDAYPTSRMDGIVYYFNIKTGENFKKMKLNKKNFLVDQNKDKYKWVLSKETKKIQGYTCYRATKKIERPKKIITVTAWYTPSIPIPFGPKGYNKLPGLILSIEEFGINYEAISVKLTNKNKKIIDPEGIEISKEKFSQKLDSFSL